MVVIGLLSFVIVVQERQGVWETEILRVQFDDSMDLQRLNGCYENDMRRSTDKAKRDLYISDDHTNSSARFGFCVEERYWSLYEGNDEADPCNITESIVKSDNTDSFDISTSFLESWFTNDGTPADIQFFEKINSDTELHCDAFMNDGVCDDAWNKKFRNYDGGDCCAPTCKHASCGKNALEKVFNSNAMPPGDGYPNCFDDDFVPLTIRLNNFTDSKDLFDYSEENRKFIDTFRADWWNWSPRDPLLTLYCDGIKIMNVHVDPSMKSQSETVKVNDGADCEIRIDNNAGTAPGFTDLPTPIWYVDYTVYNGDGDQNSPILVEGFSKDNSSASFELIPSCEVKALSDHIPHDTSLQSLSNPSSEAIDWMLKRDESKSGCRENLVELFALSVLNFAAPGSPQRLWIENGRLCSWESIWCNVDDLFRLDLPGLGLSGPIATEIGLLSNLVWYNVGMLLHFYIERAVVGEHITLIPFFNVPSILKSILLLRCLKLKMH
jgi:hypothetical protein